MSEKSNADPFFQIVMQGLEDEVDGESFWDAVDENAVFEFSYRFPGLPSRIEGRAAYQKWFESYTNILDRADNLQIYKDREKHVVILDYEVHGKSQIGREYRNRFCSIVRIENRKIVHWIDFSDTFSAFQAMHPE